MRCHSISAIDQTTIINIIIIIIIIIITITIILLF